MNNQRVVVLFLAGLVLFSFEITPVSAQAKKEKTKVTSYLQQIEGEVSSITKDSISIVYKKDLDRGVEYESLITLDGDYKMQHKANLNQVGVGDIIKVQYEEVLEEGEKESRVRGRIARVITFLKPAEKRPPASDLSADEAQPAGIAIKGMKSE